MKVWVLYESYWDDPHNYIKGITTDENTTTHWEKTKPQKIAGRDIDLYETIDDMLELNRTINTEEHRKIYEGVKSQ